MTRRREQALTGDAAMVRRASRGVAAQTMVLVFGAMLVLVLLVSLFVVRSQSSAADTTLRGTVANADDVGDPPPGAWLVMVQAGTTKATPGLPEDLTARLAALRRTAKTRTTLTQIDDENESYRVATRTLKGKTVQVVLDLTAQHEQRSRLLQAMGLAVLLGLAFAAGLGLLVGRRAVRPMAQALSLQRAFVADASHELRTPLTLLSTRAQLLDRAVQAGSADAQTRQDSRGVVDDVQRLGEVVEDLLIAADPGGRPVRELVDLAALASAAVAAAQPHASSVGVHLLAKCDDDGASFSVLGSAPGLRRALLSLVDNAIDHTPPKGLVTVSLSARPGQVVATVSDSGPGVPHEHADSVLRRFHSGGQRAGRAHFGLGLALTHDVANRHGGQLRLVPSDVGATFELVLPSA